MTYLKKIRFEYKKNRHDYWLFRCKCGVEKIIRLSHFTSGDTISCGCIRDSKLSKQSRKHGQNKTRLYRIWVMMRNRCKNPTKKIYFNRIKVSNSWNEFVPFMEWAIASGYNDSLTIDRINNDGDYEPSNCRWISIKEQQWNKRNNVKFNGETASVASRRLGGGENLVSKRVAAGWSLERAFNLSPRQ